MYNLAHICFSFKIEATTGRVYVSCKNSCARGCNNSLCDNSCLDREKKDRYYLTVSAIDGGGRRTSLPITIYLNDTNDNRPKFRYNSYQIGLLENKRTFSDGKEDLEIQVNICTCILQLIDLKMWNPHYILQFTLQFQYCNACVQPRNIHNTLIIYVLYKCN